MAAPAFVGAGSGTIITTGSGTVSKTGCTAGNMLAFHMVVRGNTQDWGAWTNETNVTPLDGVQLENLSISTQLGSTFLGENRVYFGRVTGNGTCSADATVGGSGEDILLRIYEFSGVASGTTLASIIENGGSDFDSTFGTGTSVGDMDTTTNGAERLALQFVALASNQAVGDYTGETGGDWTEAVAEYAEATGATGTLQLQSSAMASAGTVGGGSLTISSTDWGVIGAALKPAITVAPSIRVVSSGLRW